MNTRPALVRIALPLLVAAFFGLRVRAQDVGADTVINDPLPPRVSVRSDLSYDAHARQKLDLYLPIGRSEKPRPLIIYLHGGGWQKGGKADGKRFAYRYAQRGYAVACVDYRLSTDAIYPAQLEDCKAALRWLRANSERYGLDRDHVGVIGVSAGGHLAALVGAMNSSRLYETGVSMEQPSHVQAVCDFFGPVDLLKLHADAMKTGAPQAHEVELLVGGDPKSFPYTSRTANPALAADSHAAATLIIHGDRDSVVPLEQSRILYEALIAKGVTAHLHVIHGAGHTGPAFVAPDINAMVDEFFRHTLKPLENPSPLKAATVTESGAPTGP